MLERKNQTSGDNSLNIQSDKDVNLNVGISYNEARQISLDVFKSNFLELSQNAAEIAYARVQGMTDKYLRALSQKDPSLLKSAEDPDMQYALFVAQREYARTGDEQLADILVDLLVDRASENNRSLIQIVHNEALLVAPKLTGDQYDTLSVIFILRHTLYKSTKNINDLVEMLKKNIIPLSNNIRADGSCLEHLQYASCGTDGLLGRKIGETLRINYPTLFWRGVSKADIESLDNQLAELTQPCFNNTDLFQLVPKVGKTLEEDLGERGFSQTTITNIANFQKANLLEEQDIQVMLDNLLPELKSFFEVWNNSFLSRFSLTSVGMAIAHANISRRLNQKWDMNIWIN